MQNSTLLTRDFCIQKLDAAISVISRLSDADYPHTDSRDALLELTKVYEDIKHKLLNIPGAQDNTVLEYCRRANILIVKLKPFVGMLLRSTNIRNAFEIYFPIKLLAQSILGPDTKLVLSSEWTFSPFIYPIGLTELPEFIFIGIPASECQNPLIIPLAGHELGHVVWKRKGAKPAFDRDLTNLVLSSYRNNWSNFAALFNITLPSDRLESDMFLRSIWGMSLRLAQRQIEEVFCDLYGLHMFGPSFLHSFQYLLSPSLGQYRSTSYPRLRDRALFLSQAARKWGFDVQSGYADSFSEQDIPSKNDEKFIVKMADDATALLVNKVGEYLDVNDFGIQRYADSSNEEDRARASMIDLVPPVQVESIASIVNAAWSIRLSVDDWSILEHVVDLNARKVAKLRVLRDLSLKGLEVFEFNKRLEKYAT